MIAFGIMVVSRNFLKNIENRLNFVSTASMDFVALQFIFPLENDEIHYFLYVLKEKNNHSICPKCVTAIEMYFNIFD